jgi:hypothetical protein
MKKSGLAAVAVVGAAALTGSAVLPGSAATTASTVHTMRFVLHPTADRPLAGLTNAGTDTLKRKGKVVGYDSYSGKTFATSNKRVVWTSFAVRGGMVMARFTLDKSGVHGAILGGAGKYRGIKGTATDRQRANGTELVTLRYHF